MLKSSPLLAFTAILQDRSVKTPGAFYFNTRERQPITMIVIRQSYGTETVYHHVFPKAKTRHRMGTYRTTTALLTLKLGFFKHLDLADVHVV